MDDFFTPLNSTPALISNFIQNSNTENNIFVDENSDIAAQLGIRNVPTILFFKNGEILDKVVGMTTKSNLENKINSLI